MKNNILLCFLSKKKKFLWVALVILVACEDQLNTPIPMSKMKPILIDVMIAEAAVQNLTGADKDSLTRIYYNKILKLHGITEADYRQTMHILSTNPRKMRSIFDQIAHEFQIMDTSKVNRVESN